MDIKTLKQGINNVNTRKTALFSSVNSYKNYYLAARIALIENKSKNSSINKHILSLCANAISIRAYYII